MASDATATGGDGAAQADGERQGGPDLGALTQQLEGLNSSHEETRGALQSITSWIESQQQGEQQQEAGPEIDLSFLENESMFADPEQLQTNLAQTLEQAVNARVEAATGPIQQQLAEAKMEQQARDLVGEFPELGEPEVATQVVGLAGQIADANFPAEVARVLKDSPAWWRQVFLAGRGVEAANEDGAESPQTARLEGGGSAGALGAADQDTGSYFGADGGGGKLPF